MSSLTMIKSGLLLIAFASLSSCLATPKDGDATLAFYQKATLATTATTGIGAFKDTFYAFATKNCVSCHAQGQAPLFAVADVTAAYSAADDASYVNFVSPSASKFVDYAGNAHCGQPGCSGNSQVAATAISAWAAVELAVAAAGGSGGTGDGSGGTVGGGGPATGGAGAGSYVTTTLAIPANLPSGTTFVPMRWDLTTLTPASGFVSGAIFELEVQKLSTTTYRVRNPKIAGLKSIVKVTGVHVLVKQSTDPGIGVEDLGSGSVWATDVVNVAPSTKPATLPTTPLSTTTFPPLDTFSMVIGVRSNQDSFTIAFDMLESGAATAATFTSINANILQTKCVSCHSTNNKAGGFSYSNYTDTKASVVAGNPAGSQLYTSVTGTTPNMPIGSGKLTAGDTAAISTWITNGALNN